MFLLPVEIQCTASLEPRKQATLANLSFIYKGYSVRLSQWVIFLVYITNNCQREFLLYQILPDILTSTAKLVYECWDRFSHVTSSEGIAMLDL